MTQLKEVAIGLIDPNPFRDGAGGNPPATWKTVQDAYGFDPAKLAELKASYEKNGVWAGAHARETGGRYQLAFGHHRIKAAQDLKLKTLPLIVSALSDDQMLQMMAAENSEEYGHDFSLSVMNAVEAVVRAYGAGLVELEKPGDDAPKAALRSAPTFSPTSQGGCTYNAVTVSKYLGWTRDSERQGPQAAKRVLTALSALELIERGILKREQFLRKNQSQAAALVQFSLAAQKAEEADIDAEVGVRTAALKKAEKEGDKVKAEKQAEVISTLEAQREERKTRAAKSAAADAAERLKRGMSAQEVLREAASKRVEASQKRSQGVQRGVARPPATASDREALGGRLDRLLLEDEREWIIRGMRGGASDKRLLESVKQLETRLRLFRKGIEGKVGVA